MKTKATIKSLQNALKKKKGAKKKSALESVLRNLKNKQSRLKEKIADAKSDKEKKTLNAKLKVNRAHRKKGEKALAKLDD